MFIDTHCHLTDDYSEYGGLDAVVTSAINAGVGVIICPTADPDAISPAINIAKKYDNVFNTIGIHPEYAGIDATQFITHDILNNQKVLGIGEIGLDYHEFDCSNRNEQIKLFEQQLNLANQYNLPVAIHTRDAESDTFDILSSNKIEHGVMHCFTSSYDLAKKMLNHGFFFSASGILTFKNATDVRETFAKIPLDRIVIETDSPWCAPVPFRGKRCVPKMVIETAKVLANIHNIELDKLETILMTNTKHLYPRIVF